MSELFGKYIEIKGKLEVLTPLRMGSGEIEVDEKIDKVDGKHPTSRRVQQGHDSKPYLPGSSLKGALRSFAREAGTTAAHIASLFGEIKHSEKQRGTMGKLIVYGASFVSAPVKKTLPLQANKEHGRAIAARTKIDAGRGTAEEHKLFHSEEIAPGTLFDFHARYFPAANNSAANNSAAKDQEAKDQEAKDQEAKDQEAKDQEARTLLGSLLQALAGGSIAFGAGTGDGAGRLKLIDWELQGKSVDSKTGSLINDNTLVLGQGAQTLQRQGDRYTLILTCEGPYFSNDWSYEPPKEKDKDKNKEPQVKALKVADGKPALPAESLMGVLRSRAEWLRQIHSCPENVIENLFGQASNADKTFKGRLEIEELVCTSQVTETKLASVKLDRFSGAPIDGALFKVECPFGPAFEAKLLLNERGSETHASNCAREFLGILLDDICTNGIKLGHASNRGFGWFTVKQQTGAS